MGRGSENLPLARASRLARPSFSEATGAAVGGLHGRSIVVRERKGSALGVPLAPVARIAIGESCAVRISARHYRAQARPRQEGALRASRAAITRSTIRG